MTSKAKQAVRIARLERQVLKLAQAARFGRLTDNEIAAIIRAPEIGRPRLNHSKPKTTPQRAFNLPECSAGCETPPWDHCDCTQAPAWFAAEDAAAMQHLRAIC